MKKRAGKEARRQRSNQPTIDEGTMDAGGCDAISPLRTRQLPQRFARKDGTLALRTSKSRAAGLADRLYKYSMTA